MTLTILKRPLSVQSEDNSLTPYTYNARVQSVKGDKTVTGLLAGDSLTDLTYLEGQGNTGTDVTDHPVLLNDLAVMDGAHDVTANYAISFLPGRLVIVPLNIPAANIPIRDVTAEYDGQPHSLSLPATIRTSVGTLTLTDEFTVQYRDASGNVTDTMPAYTDVGVYPVTVILTSISGNFAPEEVTATVTVTPRALRVSYGKVSVAYDGLPHTVPLTVTGLVSRDTLYLTEQHRTETDVTYLVDGTPGALVATATGWLLTDAADPTIDRSANYTLTLVPGSIEIKPMALKITVQNLTVQYDGLPHTLEDYTVTGALKDGDSLAVTLEANTATNVADSREVTVASAIITNATTGDDTTRNYAITIVPGKLTISPRPLALLASNLTVLYDGLPHTPDVFHHRSQRSAARPYAGLYAAGQHAADRRGQLRSRYIQQDQDDYPRSKRRGCDQELQDHLHARRADHRAAECHLHHQLLLRRRAAIHRDAQRHPRRCDRHLPAAPDRGLPA